MKKKKKAAHKSASLKEKAAFLLPLRWDPRFWSNGVSSPDGSGPGTVFPRFPQPALRDCRLSLVSAHWRTAPLRGMGAGKGWFARKRLHLRRCLSTGHIQVRRTLGVPSSSPANRARAPPWAGGHETWDFNLVCLCWARDEDQERSISYPFWWVRCQKSDQFVQNLARIFCMLAYWLLVEGWFQGQTSWREQNWPAMLLWTGHRGNKAFGLLFSVY